MKRRQQQEMNEYGKEERKRKKINHLIRRGWEVNEAEEVLLV